MLSNLFWFVPAASATGLIFAYIFFRQMKKKG